MSSSILNKPLAKHISFDDDNMWVETTDGRKLSVPLVYFPRLKKATNQQKANYVISGGGIGLHWDDIDEDISVENLFLGIYDFQSKAWQAHSQSA
jgi:hypothetical protein